MTIIERILLRRDIAAISVATVIGFLTFQFLAQIAAPLANRIGVPSDAAQPIVAADFYIPAAAYALALVGLELLLIIVVFARQLLYKKTRQTAKKKK